MGINYLSRDSSWKLKGKMGTIHMHRDQSILYIPLTTSKESSKYIKGVTSPSPFRSNHSPVLLLAYEFLTKQFPFAHFIHFNSVFVCLHRFLTDQYWSPSLHKTVRFRVRDHIFHVLWASVGMRFVACEIGDGERRMSGTE